MSRPAARGATIVALAPLLSVRQRSRETTESNQCRGPGATVMAPEPTVTVCTNCEEAEKDHSSDIPLQWPGTITRTEGSSIPKGIHTVSSVPMSTHCRSDPSPGQTRWIQLNLGRILESGDPPRGVQNL